MLPSFAPETIRIAREPALKKPRPCYVCKQPFTAQHFFYQYLCLSCGDFNYHKRAVPADLTGRVALVTGARVKIGYATALRLLRAGAQVIATTRFHTTRRAATAANPISPTGTTAFTSWPRFPLSTHFIAHLYASYPALLINNAAQTVRHPLDYYIPDA